MDIKSIIIASVVVAAVGLIIAVLLSVAEKVFHVEVDEKEIKVREALAGNNCGACGYSTCREKAWAVADMQAVTLLLRRLPKAKHPSMLALLPAKKALKK